MAKNNQTAEKEQNPKNSNNLKFKIKINSKTEQTHTETNFDDVSSPEHSLNDTVSESSKGMEQNGVNKGVSDVEKEKNKRKNKCDFDDLVKNNSKRRNKSNKEEEEVVEEKELEEKSESGIGYIPMNRVSRIVRSDNSDIKISQEAVFLINRATEKFLQLFCKEAYDFAFHDRKKSVAYNHLSSVVSEQPRYEFLSDFVPEKVKAEDALAQIETDK